MPKDKLATVNAEIAELEALASQKANQHAALENEMSISGDLDEGKLLQFPALTAGIAIIGKRLGLLREDKAAIERENSFKTYEEMTRQQFDHFTEFAAVDAAIEQLQAQMAALVSKRSDMKGNNQAPSNRRIKLYLALNSTSTPEERERLQQIAAKYRVGKYF